MAIGHYRRGVVVGLTRGGCRGGGSKYGWETGTEGIRFASI